MPAGSGHGFVQLVSCGLRAALFYDLLSAPGAEEQDFAAGGPRPGSALDPQGASPLTHILGKGR